MIVAFEVRIPHEIKLNKIDIVIIDTKRYHGLIVLSASGRQIYLTIGPGFEPLEINNPLSILARQAIKNKFPI